MLSLYCCCVYFLALCTALPLWGSPITAPAHDETCSVDNRAFSGIRVYRNHTIDVHLKLSLESHVVIVDCDKGTELHRLVLPSNYSIFNQSIKLGNEKDIRIARRPNYISNSQLRYFPGAIIGGVYQAKDQRVPSSTVTDVNEWESPRDTQWEPISPLVADGWSVTHYGWQGHTNHTQIWLATSMLRSPDVLEPSYSQSMQWTELIPVLEAVETA